LEVRELCYPLIFLALFAPGPARPRSFGAIPYAIVILSEATDLNDPQNFASIIGSIVPFFPSPSRFYPGVIAAHQSYPS